MRVTPRKSIASIGWRCVFHSALRCAAARNLLDCAVMTLIPDLSAHADPAARVAAFTRSEIFDRLFKEGIGLVEETAAYLDGSGRQSVRDLGPAATLVYAAESMRLTTRLMQVASWLLVQRAVREGELSYSEASGADYRLDQREWLREAESSAEAMPDGLADLSARASAIYERVLRFDQKLYQDAAPAPENPVQSQLSLLARAFAGKGE